MLYKVLARESIAVSSTALGFTTTYLTGRLMYARVQVQVAQVRVTEDGTTPDPAGPVGEIYNPGDSFEVWESSALANFLAIRETTTDAVLEVTYMGSGG
jgi:hypothetical protein